MRTDGSVEVAASKCDHGWVSVDDLAEELQIPKSTIYGWKSRGAGPQWVRVGKHLRARRTTVDTWLNSLNGAA
ncbi:helix-turn-helix domain-containing protein [Streptomyces microflavus]|uniref:helix-turn-helix transcriptional regulator n=1 Tax=Streptomyces microflavus TaxID=1919 RepID=UPI0033C9C60A